MPIPLTASTLDLAKECTYPFCPDAPNVPATAQGPQAALGTAFHYCCEFWVRSVECRKSCGKSANVSEKMLSDPVGYLMSSVPKDKLAGVNKESLKGLLSSAWPTLSSLPVAATAEVCLSWNFAVCRATERKLIAWRKYAPGRDEMMGTADLAWDDGLILDWRVLAPARRHDHNAAVADWKTSSQPREYGEDNWPLQLDYHAMCWASVLGLSAMTAIVYAVSPMATTLFAKELSADDLNEVEATIERIWRKTKERMFPSPGVHCDKLWCPMRQQCPAFSAVMG